MIIYKLVKGQAINLRFCSDDYVLEADEITINGDILPDIQTLHTEEYKVSIDAYSYKEDRRNLYNQRGATIQNLTVALWEKDQAEIDRIEKIRQQVKKEIPKP